MATPWNRYYYLHFTHKEKWGPPKSRTICLRLMSWRSWDNKMQIVATWINFITDIIIFYQKKTISYKDPLWKISAISTQNKCMASTFYILWLQGRAREWLKPDFLVGQGWIHSTALNTLSWTGVRRIQIPGGTLNLALVIVINNLLLSFAKHLLCVSILLITLHTGSHC